MRTARLALAALALLLRPGHGVHRRGLLQRGIGATGIIAAQPWRSAAATEPRVTGKLFFDLSVVMNSQADEKEPVRLVVGLFGEEAPEAVRRTRTFCTEGEYDPIEEADREANFGGAMFFKANEGVLELSPVRGVREKIDSKGNTLLMYNKRQVYTVPDKPERNDLTHQGAGLLTRSRYASDPSFGITLESAPRRDRDSIVFGRIIDEESTANWLSILRSIPTYSDRSTEKEGSLADEVFQAQRRFFRDMAIANKDTRAVDRTGLLLRRVQVVRCGRIE